jgi:hypothetical protein
MPCIVLSACDEYYMPDLGQALQWSDPKTVREVLVSTSNQRLLAFRADPEQAFEIVIARRGRKDLERCTAGPGFARFLEAASSIFMVTKVKPVVETDTEDWVTVETWDASTNPGTELRLRAPTSATRERSCSGGSTISTSSSSMTGSGPTLLPAAQGLVFKVSKRRRRHEARVAMDGLDAARHLDA